MVTQTGSTVRDRLRAGLREALRAREPVALAALRSALAAIDNAEAVDAAERPALGLPVSGLRATEAARRELTIADQERIVQSEIDDRIAAAEAIERAGHPERARRLRTEAGILLACLRPVG